MTDVERLEWRKTGTLPSEPPAPVPQADGDASEDADEAEPPAASSAPVDAAAASEAGKALAARKRTAQQRINDLTRDKYRLEGELQALRAQSSRPAAAVDPQPHQTRASSPSPLPPGFAFPTWDQWSAQFPDRGYEDYGLAASAALIAFDRQQSAQYAQLQHIVTTFADRVTAYKADHPDYDAVTSNPDVLAVAHPYLHRAIAESPLGPQVAYYLGSHVDECRSLASQPTQAAFDRAFGKLEARLEQPSAPAGSTPNHITQAPAPPPTLGSRPAVPGDEIEAAVRRKDPGEYMRVMNARELASRSR